MKYQLLVLDIDGTLVGKTGGISVKNRQVLALAVKSGIKVSLCSGRSLTGCLPVLEATGLNGNHVFYDGALVINPRTRQEVYAEGMDAAAIRKAIGWTRIHGLDIELYSSTQYFAEHENWSTDIHRRFFNTFACFTDYFEVAGRERIIKIGAVAANKEEKRKIQAFCRDFEGTFNFSWVTSPSFPEVEFINIVSPQVSKGRAVAALAEHLAIEKESIFAIGDGMNDISMLSAAGFGVAMLNSPEELKKTADYITLDVEDDGLAAAVEKFILN